MVVLSGEGDHFCAGLDLSELSERSVAQGIDHSRSWHAAFEQIQFGRVPVIAVLHGAVVGGGLELASSAHLRVAEAGTFDELVAKDGPFAELARTQHLAPAQAQAREGAETGARRPRPGAHRHAGRAVPALTPPSAGTAARRSRIAAAGG